MQDNPRILPMDLEQEMKTSFISYAMAVIIDRALPDVRDGLKPVHRRILWDMWEQGFTPDKQFHKSARIVGDVMGKYHPHGDSSVYDAMVRLAQDFNQRYMLVEGQGNYGSVDGDPAAASRYTEARMAKISLEMLADINKNTVDFVPNFDETLEQPTVLPSRIPNLLVNGSGGIAVGMATNIPPHNLGEVMDAYIAMIDNRDITVDELMAYIPGPDFPTGGIIMGTAGVRQAYRTGRGKVVVRAKTIIEEGEHGKNRIIVTELPYQVNKANLVAKIAELVNKKLIDGIVDMRDVSNREGIKIIIDLRRDANASVVLNLLYKHTQLQDTFGVINLALVDGEPKVLNLREMLRHYLEHQEQVVTRRTKFDLDKALERLHIIEGLLRALDCIDEIIETIKKSANSAAAKENLMEQFDFSDKQAQAILDMRLARLSALEREKLEAEEKELEGQVEYYRSILADEGLLLKVLRDEATVIRNKYVDGRKTEITIATDDIDLDDIIQEEDMVVTLTELGYVKRCALDTYKSQHRGGRGITGQTTREEDYVKSLFMTSTHSDIMYFTNLGRVFRMKCYTIPEASRTAKGTPLVNLLQLRDGEKVVYIAPITDGKEWIPNVKYLALATKQGIIKKMEIAEFESVRKNGLIAQNLREGDELIACMLSSGDSEFLIGTRQGKCIRFHEDDVRAMGRTATGVTAIVLDDGDEVVDAGIVKSGEYVLTVSENGIGKRTPEEEYRQQRRHGKGVRVSALTEKTGDLSCMKVCTGDEDLIMISDDGTLIRLPVGQINATSRNTQGVRLMRLQGEAKVVSVELVPRDEEETAEIITPDTAND